LDEITELNLIQTDILYKLYINEAAYLMIWKGNKLSLFRCIICISNRWTQTQWSMKNRKERFSKIYVLHRLEFAFPFLLPINFCLNCI